MCLSQAHRYTGEPRFLAWVGGCMHLLHEACVCMRVCMYVCVYVCVCVCLSCHIYEEYVCVCVCMYVRPYMVGGDNVCMCVLTLSTGLGCVFCFR